MIMIYGYILPIRKFHQTTISSLEEFLLIGDIGHVTNFPNNFPNCKCFCEKKIKYI